MDHVHVQDRGLNYGDGLFETIAMRDGVIQFWSLHWHRLKVSAQRLRLQLPIESDCLADITALTDDQGDHLLKLILTRGVSGRGYAIPASDEHAGQSRIVMNLGEPPARGVSHDAVMVCETRLSRQPLLAGLKHLGRLEQVIARTEVEQSKCSEGLMLDSESLVIEGTQNNLFLYDGQNWFTPRLTHCGINGVYRQHLMSQFSIQEAEIRLDELVHFSSAFFCNSVRGIQVIETIHELTAFDTEPARQLRHEAQS